VHDVDQAFVVGFLACNPRELPRSRWPRKIARHPNSGDLHAPPPRHPALDHLDQHDVVVEVCDKPPGTLPTTPAEYEGLTATWLRFANAVGNRPVLAAFPFFEGEHVGTKSPGQQSHGRAGFAFIGIGHCTAGEPPLREDKPSNAAQPLPRSRESCCISVQMKSVAGVGHGAILFRAIGTKTPPPCHRVTFSPVSSGSLRGFQFGIRRRVERPAVFPLAGSSSSLIDGAGEGLRR